MKLLLLWTLLSAPYSVHLYQQPCPCPFDTVDFYRIVCVSDLRGADKQVWLEGGMVELSVNVPRPLWPTRSWYCMLDGDTVDVYWTPAWDFNADGMVDLSDFAIFGGQWQRPWDLTDLAAFGDMFDKPSGYWWRYAR